MICIICIFRNERKDVDLFLKDVQNRCRSGRKLQIHVSLGMKFVYPRRMANSQQRYCELRYKRMEKREKSDFRWACLHQLGTLGASERNWKWTVSTAVDPLHKSDTLDIKIKKKSRFVPTTVAVMTI